MATHLKHDIAEEFVRGRPIPSQNVENGYDQNWYPICLSEELKTGEIYGSEFMNGRIIAMRGADGRPQVLSAYCRHLGADLKDAAIVDGQIRCPYHYWRYDSGGQCVATAVGDKPPANAKLFRFPTAEALGFVWAFNGLEPLYDVPHFALPEDELVIKREFEYIVGVDHFIPYSNSSDIQHLTAVHNIELTVNPEDVDIRPHGMSYLQKMNIPGVGELNQLVTVFGTNCLVFQSEFMGREVWNMSAGKALNGNRTMASLVVATCNSRGAPGEDQMIDAVLEAALMFGRNLFAEDDAIMNSIRFRQDILTYSDRMLANYLNYVRSYPRTNIACDMIA